MKIIFNIVLIFLALVAFVPPFRRFLFYLLVGRQLVKQQRKQEQREATGVRVDKTPSNSKGSRFEGGEYVDYEEVKD